jgi:lysophospholipase L1-like esterase
MQKANSSLPVSGPNRLGKTVIALAVFSTIVGGWAAYQARTLNGGPLPDAGGRQGSCVLWFIGSSSIHRWTTLDADMAPWIARNRGVDGALLPQLRRRFAIEDVAVAPDAIVFYAGDNDIAKGESATEVADRFRKFLSVKTVKMPHVPMLVLSVKPSPGRWPMRTVQLAYDQAVRDTAARSSNLTFVDASEGLLVGGRPGPYFVGDGVHLNAAGYGVWAQIVRSALSTQLPRPVVDRCLKAPRDDSAAG